MGQVIETPELPVDVDTGLRVKQEDLTQRRRSKTIQKREELVEYLLFGVSKPQWFTGEIDLSEASLVLISEFAQGTKKDIDFLASAIKYAREHGQNADMVYAALAILASSDRAEAKQQFLNIFNDVIRINQLPGKAMGDMSAFMQIIKAKIFRGFGKIIQKALKGWIQGTLTPENALALYAQNREPDEFGGRAVNSFMYRDIVRLSHYKARNDQEKFLIKFLCGARYINASNAPTQEIKNFIKYRRIITIGDKADFLENNKMNFYLATRLYTDPVIWQKAFKHADIIDMVMGLNNLRKYQVFEVKANRDHFIATITDKKIIKKHKMLTPFHFMKLYDAYVGNEEEILGALKQAIDISYCNLPETNKTVALVLDNSANMAAMGIAYSRSLNAKRVINTLGSIIYKYVPSCYIIPFAETAKEISVRKSLPTADVADVISMEDVGSKQDPRAPFKYLFEQRIDADVIVAITKGQDWREFAFGDELSRYFIDINSSAKAFFWNLSEFRNRHTTAELPNMVFLDGPDYRVIRYILQALATPVDHRAVIESTLQQS